MTKSSTLFSVIAFFFFFFFFFPFLISMASNPSTVDGGGPAVHIVYLEQPEGRQIEAEALHLRTLASVLGSEEAAKEALVYSYKHAANGFSAKLTPQQAEQLSKQPGVLQVQPSRTYHLHGLGEKIAAAMMVCFKCA